MRWRRAGRILIAAGQGFVRHKATVHSAAMSFYAIISLAPLLLITLAVAGRLFGAQAARGELLEQMTGVFGDAGAQVVQSILANAARPGAALGPVLGVIILLVSASAVVNQLRNSLNEILGVRQPTGGRQAVRRVVLGRLISMAVVAASGILLLASVVAGVAVSALNTLVTDIAPEAAILSHAVNVLAGIFLAGLLFWLIYRFLPGRRVDWRAALTAGLITGALFSVGRLGIGLYLGHSAITSAYGAAGSLLVIVLWIYYTSMIVLFGAALTRAIEEAPPPNARQRRDDTPPNPC